METIKNREKLKEYKELLKKYKEFDKKIGSTNDVRELANSMTQFVNENIEDLVPEILFDRFERNLKKIRNKKNKEVPFLSSYEDIKNALIDPVFLTKLKEKMAEVIKSYLNAIPRFSLDEFTKNQKNIYFIEIVTDSYSYAKYQGFFYFDPQDEKVMNGYLNIIYKEELVPFMELKYNKQEVNKAVNTEKFSICSMNDFQEDNCTSEISMRNIRNLIRKLIELVETGTKLVENDEILKIYELKLIIDFIEINNPGQKNYYKNKEKIEPKVQSPLSSEKQIVDKIKEKFIILLKGSVKASNEYVGFFKKEDYINWLLPKYKELGYDKLEEIFEEVVNPRPPSGVIKFVIPSDKDDNTKFYYFISMSNIPNIFDYMVKEDSDKKAAQYLNIEKRHFLTFLKKIFSEFEHSNFTDQRIADYLGISVNKVKEMRKYSTKL